MQAVDILATHPEDVRKRLHSAYLPISVLRENDFPEEYRSIWREIMKEMTKFGPILNHHGEVIIGSVENTMNRIRKKTGMRIAKNLYSLYWKFSF